eukprot:SAG25_NODE_337_length_9543_cov_4.171961_15_plen_157_part_00
MPLAVAAAGASEGLQRLQHGGGLQHALLLQQQQRSSTQSTQHSRQLLCGLLLLSAGCCVLCGSSVYEYRYGTTLVESSTGTRRAVQLYSCSVLWYCWLWLWLFVHCWERCQPSPTASRPRRCDLRCDAAGSAAVCVCEWIYLFEKLLSLIVFSNRH